MSIFYISPAGNDTTGNGSDATPWLTLTKANASSANGDTIVLKAGTYTWSTLGGMNSARSYRGASADTTILDGLNGSFSMATGVNGGVVAISDITFKNVRRTTIGADPIFDWITGPLGSLSFGNCRFKNLAAAGLNASGQNRGGIFWQSGGIGAEHVVFTNCEFNDCFTPSVSGATGYIFSPPWSTEPCAISLINCVFYFERVSPNNQTGVFLNVNSQAAYLTAMIKNCAFRANNGSTVAVFSHTANATVTSNNNCFSNMTNIPTGASHILADPLFYEESAGNFNVRPTSPCMNVGTLV